MLNNPKTTPILLLIACVLLAALLATNVLSLRSSQAQNEALQQRVIDLVEESALIRQQLEAQEAADQSKLLSRSAQAIEILDQLDSQEEIVLELFDNYQDVAYGVSIDRIAEQQLIATEYQIQALQLLAIQNRQIADLLLLDYVNLPGVASSNAGE